MPKLLLETTGAFALMDFSQNKEIHAFKPTVISDSTFINQRMGAGQLRVLHNEVPDELTDEDFQKFWQDSNGEDGVVDKDLAVQSFLTSFAPKEMTAKEKKALEALQLKHALEEKAAKAAEEKAALAAAATAPAAEPAPEEVK